MNSLHCANCNAAVGAYDRFCENCGALLPGDSANGEAPGSPYAKAVDQASGAQGESALQDGAQAQTAARDAFFPTGNDQGAFFPDEAGQAGYAQASYAQPAYAEPAYAAGVAGAGAAAAASGATAAASGSVVASGPYAQATYAQPTYANPAPTYMADPSYGAETAPGTAYGLAVASLVMGILGVLSFGIVFIFGIIGAILGIVALSMRSGYRKRGLYDRHQGVTLGMGIAGIVMNVVAVIVLVSLIAVGAMIAEDEAYSDIWDDYGIEEILDEIDA